MKQFAYLGYARSLGYPSSYHENEQREIFPMGQHDFEVAFIYPFSYYYANLYIKIPVSAEGLKAMGVLKKEGFNITATGILTSQQIVMAVQAGADYMAPYVNRADNINGDGVRVVEEAYGIISRDKNCRAKILGASFKNVKQVHDAILAGAESVTVGTDVLKQLIYHPYTDWSIDKFNSDWGKVYGNGKTLLDIL